MANTPIHSMTDLWNSGGTTYYAIKMDVTNSASAAGSKLFAMQISSVNIFDIDKTGDVTLTSVDAGAAVGPTLTLKRFSATPAAADVAGKLAFDGMDSAANVQNYADIFATITDPTTTSEDASLTFRNSVAGTMTTQAVITATGWNSMNIGATTPGTGAFTTLTASSGYNGTVGAGTPAAGAFTTIAASGTSTLVAANLTGNLSISKASPTITLTHTGTGSDSTITENSTGLTYAADANNEVASSIHIWTVDGTQAAALNTSALTLGTNVALAFAGTGAATTRTNLGLVIGTNVQAWDADLDTWAGKTAPSGVVVGTTDVQTLTNKTLTGAALNGTLGATTPSTVSATTIAASGNITITKTNPAINLVNTDSISTITEYAGGITYSADTGNAAAIASFHIFTVDGTQRFAVGASAASLSAGVSLTASAGGSLTGTWSNMGTVTTIDINGGTIDGTAIGGATPAAGAFTTISASSTLSATGTFTLVSTDAGATENPLLILDRNSASPANGDRLGSIQIKGRDSGGNTHTYADFLFIVTDTTDGSEDANISIRNSVAGTLTTQSTITATGWNSMNIGATTPGTGSFTTLNANGGGALTGTWSNMGSVTTIDINGGTIDGTAIGGATPAAGAFTTISATGDISQTKATPTFTQTDTGSGSVNFIQSNATLLFSVDGANAVASSAVQFNVDGAARMSVNATSLRMLNGITLRFATYTVATLPAGSTGDTVFATDCRVFNGAGTQEGAGLGTGGLVTYNGAAWKIEGTNVTAVA